MPKGQTPRTKMFQKADTTEAVADRKARGSYLARALRLLDLKEKASITPAERKKIDKQRQSLLDNSAKLSGGDL